MAAVALQKKIALYRADLAELAIQEADVVPRSPERSGHELEHERLGKPTALAVFASDALSSTAYASEEILRALVPAIGFLAFTSFLVPITGALVAVLVILVFSYRQTIKAYPSAGGAYIVTKDNLGLLPPA